MESLVIDPDFWRGRRVYLTGHTGFKGAWMSLLLHRIGALVTGFALQPEPGITAFAASRIEKDLQHEIGDIRDGNVLQRSMTNAEPEIVIHMAAQALVRRSYAEPVATYATNVMGTVNVLEAARRLPDIKAMVVVTSDKCYLNEGHPRGFKENDPLGGYDPYSSSKAATEIATDSYRRSFFGAEKGTVIASGRAGNVIGGGDWAEDRLVPDAIRAFMNRQSLSIRNPTAIRPWQHVLDPVIAYLRLAEQMIGHGHAFAEAWNFGPSQASEVPVSTIATTLVEKWDDGAGWTTDTANHPHEAAYLRLDTTKARERLGWRPMIELDHALALTVDWYKAAASGRTDLRNLMIEQIEAVLRRASALGKA